MDYNAIVYYSCLLIAILCWIQRSYRDRRAILKLKLERSRLEYAANTDKLEIEYLRGLLVQNNIPFNKFEDLK